MAEAEHSLGDLARTRDKRLRVVKLGGSLLDWPAWPARLAAWLAEAGPAATVIVAGGGGLARAIRTLDEAHHIDSAATHWLCIRTMSIQSEVAAALLGRVLAAVVRTSDWTALGTGCETVVFDPAAFLAEVEPALPGTPLPAGWAATSDSIAARVAECLGAAELTLCKSADPPAAAHEALAAAGYIDEHFPAAARGLPLVRFVNLRSC